jgi:hypothetical protein
VLLLRYFVDIFDEDPALGLEILARLEVAEGQLGLVGSLQRKRNMKDWGK